jgi:hypothetical protein
MGVIPHQAEILLGMATVPGQERVVVVFLAALQPQEGERTQQQQAILPRTGMGICSYSRWLAGPVVGELLAVAGEVEAQSSSPQPQEYFSGLAGASRLMADMAVETLAKAVGAQSVLSRRKSLEG